MAEMASFALWLTVMLFVYAAAAFTLGAPANRRLVTSGQNALWGAALMTTFSSGVLLNRLIALDFSFAYVASHTSTHLPLLYRISAFWAGQEGSLLLWLWLLAVMAAVAIYTKPERMRELMPYAGAVLALTGAFFAVIVALVANPFDQLASRPFEGAGLNLLLQNPGMVVHPPLLFIGYVGLAIPFAFGMASLWRRRSDDAWLKASRPWLIFSWLALTVGIVYGAKWAYVELGWGGYWGWDPVENASLMPWLVATAFIHSSIVQKRLGMFKIWNVVLIATAFGLTLFGTYLTRSGVLNSVHAFGDRALGNYILAMIITATLAVGYLILSRWSVLRSQHRIQRLWSKETGLLTANLLFVTATAAVFIGTMLPLLSEWVGATRMTAGPPFFNRVFVPFALGIVLLAGIGPALRWRTSSGRHMRTRLMIPAVGALLIVGVLIVLGMRRPMALLAVAIASFTGLGALYEMGAGVRRRVKGGSSSLVGAFGSMLVRQNRRYGAYFVHLALAIMVIGFTGSSMFALEQDTVMHAGDTVGLGSYEVTFSGLKEARTDGVEAVVYTDLDVKKNGTGIGPLRPETVFTANSEEPASEVAILGSLAEDLYVVLSGWSGRDTAMFKMIINPMVSWIWIGMYLMVAGTLVAVGMRYIPVTARDRDRSHPAVLAQLSEGGTKE